LVGQRPLHLAFVARLAHCLVSHDLIDRRAAVGELRVALYVVLSPLRRIDMPRQFA